MAVLKNILKKLGGWPVLDPYEWERWKFDALKMHSKIVEVGYPGHTFIKAGVHMEPCYNSSRHTFYVCNNPAYSSQYLYPKTIFYKSIRNKFTLWERGFWLQNQPFFKYWNLLYIAKSTSMQYTGQTCPQEIEEQSYLYVAAYSSG